MDAGAPRKLAEAAKGGAVAGARVHQDLLGPVEQAGVGNRRIGLRQPEHGGQVAEQKGSEQRCRVLQTGVVGGERHPVVTDPHEAGCVGKLVLDCELGVEPVGAVPAQDEGPRRAVGAEPREGLIDRLRGPGGGGCNDQVQVRATACPRPSY